MYYLQYSWHWQKQIWFFALPGRDRTKNVLNMMDKGHIWLDITSTCCRKWFNVENQGRKNNISSKMMTVLVLFEDFEGEAQIGFQHTIYLCLLFMECLNFPPFSSYRCRLPGLLKIHFIIIIILWTSDPAEQCKPISIHIILIQNPIAGAGWPTWPSLTPFVSRSSSLSSHPPRIWN